jgi:hypothetical protein
MTRKFSRWALHSPLDRTVLELHSAMLTQPDSNPSAFRQLRTEFSGVMELLGYFYDCYPGLTFERDVVERLAHYSLSVDCDFYYFVDEAKNSSQWVSETE